MRRRRRASRTRPRQISKTGRRDQPRQRHNKGGGSLEPPPLLCRWRGWSLRPVLLIWRGLVLLARLLRRIRGAEEATQAVCQRRLRFIAVSRQGAVCANRFRGRVGSPGRVGLRRLRRLHWSHRRRGGVCGGYFRSWCGSRRRACCGAGPGCRRHWWRRGHRIWCSCRWRGCHRRGLATQPVTLRGYLLVLRRQLLALDLKLVMLGLQLHVLGAQPVHLFFQTRIIPAQSPAAPACGHATRSKENEPQDQAEDGSGKGYQSSSAAKVNPQEAHSLRRGILKDEDDDCGDNNNPDDER